MIAHNKFEAGGVRASDASDTNDASNTTNDTNDNRSNTNDNIKNTDNHNTDDDCNMVNRLHARAKRGSAEARSSWPGRGNYPDTRVEPPRAL